jgi:type I restriction enzyme S subunit
MPELKPGWRRVKFGEVVRLAKGRSADPLAEGIERYVGLEHIEPGDLRIRSWGDVADGTTFTSRFRPGHVLFGKRRAYQRKVAVADFDGVCSGDIYVLESADPGQLLPELLPYICQTDAFFEHAVGTSAGSLSPRTNWTSLAEYEFALPPLNEQETLVARLSAFRAVCDATSDAITIAELMRRAQLFHWFRPDRGGVDRFPNHWKITTVGEAGGTQVGIRKHPGSLNGANMQPYLRVANVLDGEIVWTDIMEIHVPASDQHRCALQDGDILINKGNSMNLVGRGAIFRSEMRQEPCYFQDHLLRFRPREGVAAELAHAYFQHLLYTLQFTRIAVATTSIATIPLAKFENLPFPIPPEAEQKAIVDITSSLTRGIEALHERRRHAFQILSDFSQQCFTPVSP